MIKNIFYILIIILGGVTAYFATSTKAQLQEKIAETEEAAERVAEIARDVEDQEDALKLAKDENEAAEDALNLSLASLENEADKEKSLKSSLGEIDASLEESNEEILKIEGAIATAEAIIREILPNAGNNLDIDAVVGHIESLESQRNEKQLELEEKTEIVGQLAKKATSAAAQKERLQSRLAKIRKRIALNSVTASVTAVETGYGFVVINRGSNNSNIDAQSELLVSRNGNFIGRLKVASVEPNQTVCDIVHSSLKPGQRIHHGDRVTLKQAVAN